METPLAPRTLSLPRRNTDPLWLQDYFLQTGHDADTRSGTGTFVKRKGRVYVCTCRHILDGLGRTEVVQNARFPTLAFGIDGGFLNLSRMTVEGPHQLMRSPVKGTKHENTDIAIAEVPQSMWDLLVSRKEKSPINLDEWREPDWAKVRYGLANGYPDEHKKNVTAGDHEQVANQLVTVVAEFASTPRTGQQTITLNSILDDPHSWFFSGLSGGPIYVVESLEDREVEDDELLPVAIVFEGFPSSGVANASEVPGTTFLTDKDLFIRGLALTPENFDEWLRDCGLVEP